MVKSQADRNWVFYYDGECGFCAGTVRRLARADLFRQVNWVAFQDLPVPPEGLVWSDLANAAYLETYKRWGPSGGDVRRDELYRGFYAFRMLSLRLPPLMPLVPLLWLPGVPQLGEFIYARIAANRYRISRRCRLKLKK